MSNSIEDRLVEIFEDVILDGLELDKSKHQNDYDNWDSLATVTLLTVITDEFGPIVSINDIERFKSFESILELLYERIN